MDIFHSTCSFDCIFPPTNLRMSPQVARRTRIPCVQITPNLLTVPSFAFAVLRSTLKNVNTAAINVVD
jgi:hypothetical protein